MPHGSREYVVPEAISTDNVENRFPGRKSEDA